MIGRLPLRSGRSAESVMQLTPRFPNITDAHIVQHSTEYTQSMTIQYSIIIPVYNRPGELRELLESLYEAKSKSPHTEGLSWEVIVVEDGSAVQSRDICNGFSDEIELAYLYQENAGPAAARNTGARSARGEWLLFFDSDCLVPAGYFDAVSKAIRDGSVDFFGGPDRAAEEFTATQKAIDYAMTSFVTTGGIRGGRRKLDTYYPRSFNMGVRKAAFDDVEGFSGLRFGEDLDLSMRLMKAGYRSALIEGAWVYHKRRTDLKKFFKQVYNSGMARIVLNRLHPGTLKAVHLLPSLFVLYLLAALLSLLFISGVLWYPVGILILILFVDGFRSTGSMGAALLSPAAGLVQLSGYGTGLIHSFLLVHILRRKRASAFDETFYK